MNDGQGRCRRESGKVKSLNHEEHEGFHTLFLIDADKANAYSLQNIT